jgi:hypothetical protein
MFRGAFKKEEEKEAEVFGTLHEEEQVNAIYRFVRTSQETHYVSAASPKG